MDIAKKEFVVFPVKLHPSAGRDRLAGVRDGVLRAEVCAPPSAGKANRSLIRLLSKHLGVPKSSLTIRRGQKQPFKLIAVSGLSAKDFQKRLDEKSLG